MPTSHHKPHASPSAPQSPAGRNGHPSNGARAAAHTDEPNGRSKALAGRKKLGFGHWMRRVLSVHTDAMEKLEADTVHDLRVALRRCRSMADGLMDVDSDPAWSAMKKSGRKLFRKLGTLRDVHVLMEWVEKLQPAGDTAGRALLASLHEREFQLKQQTADSVSRFDRVQWKSWAKHLAKRAERVPLDGPVFRHIALERWQEAYELHRTALRNRSRAAWHRLRIGLKHFRYSVENFLPSAHAEWGGDLKHLQDLLGEVHDLDMLWESLTRLGKAFNATERAHWHEVISKERQKRLDEYRQKMTGPESLWHVWRCGLPQGVALEASGLQKLRTWAAFVDKDLAHAEHVSRLALELFNGMAAARLPGPYREPRNRLLLRTAALLHNVGHAAGRKGHHKESYRLIRKMTPPIGWSREDMEIVALVARYHRGAWPRAQHRGYAELAPVKRESVLHLGGILRLAAAFDHAHTRAVKRLYVQNHPGALLIWAQGYRQYAENARILAAERHLLERALRKPVIIRPRPTSPQKAQQEEAAALVA